MSKQDGYSPRTPADLERKYKFGQTFAEIYDLASDARSAAIEAKNAYEGLSQNEIFNLLTDFGKSQGVYRDDTGNVYMNASYIKSGKLLAEYIDAENLKVSAANITGELVATQIDTKDLKVLAANITGTLTAGQIDTTNLKVSAANITGMLTIGQLPTTVAEIGDIPWKTSQMTNDSGYQNETGVVSIINGTVTADYVNALDVTAKYLRGGTIYLQPSQYYTAGYMTLTGSDSSNFAVEVGSYGALRMVASSGAAFISSTQYNTWVMVTGEIVLGGSNTRPGSDNTFLLGTPYYRWNDIYSYNATITTSDMNAKKDVVYGLDEYDSFFDSLKPVSYLFKGGTSGRRHIGMISQDVEQALADNDLTSLEFAGFIKSPKEDENGNIVEGEYIYGLRYGEFISMCVAQIQNLKKRVKELEASK